MNIGIDFDGVIVDTTGLKVNLAKEVLGIDLSVENTTREGALRAGIDAETYDNIFKRIIISRKSHEIPLVEYAKETIDLICLNHPEDKIFIITSRSDFEVPYQRNILDKKRIRYHHIINTSDRSKNRTCLENKITAYIDDDLHKLQQITNGYTQRFLLTRPYNKNIEIKNPGIERVENWLEFYEKIKRLRQ